MLNLNLPKYRVDIIYCIINYYDIIVKDNCIFAVKKSDDSNKIFKYIFKRNMSL